MTDKSIIQYSAERGGYHCGYCGSASTKYSHGVFSGANICKTVVISYTNVGQVIRMAEQSIVEYFTDDGGGSCGYCHSSSTSYSHGVFSGVNCVCCFSA